MEKTIYTDEYRGLLDWLRDQRKRGGLTLRTLGAKLGVHHSVIGRIEQGERRLDIVEFVQLCRAIGCDSEEGLDLLTTRTPVAKAAEARSSYGTRRSSLRQQKDPDSPKGSKL